MADVHPTAWEERGISEPRVYFIVRTVLAHLKEAVKHSACPPVSCHIGNGPFGLETWRGRRVSAGCPKSAGFAGPGQWEGPVRPRQLSRAFAAAQAHLGLVLVVGTGGLHRNVNCSVSLGQVLF